MTESTMFHKFIRRRRANGGGVRPHKCIPCYCSAGRGRYRRKNYMEIEGGGEGGE